MSEIDERRLLEQERVFENAFVVLYRYRAGRIAQQELYDDPSGQVEQLCPPAGRGRAPRRVRAFRAGLQPVCWGFRRRRLAPHGEVAEWLKAQVC